MSAARVAPPIRLLALALALLSASMFATGGCEPGIDIFYECGPDGACEDGLQCYRDDAVAGYCTATCYGGLECPRNAVCYDGACVLICLEGGEACPGGTTCDVIEAGRGLCRFGVEDDA